MTAAVVAAVLGTQAKDSPSLSSSSYFPFSPFGPE